MMGDLARQAINEGRKVQREQLTLRSMEVPAFTRRAIAQAGFEEVFERLRERSSLTREQIVALLSEASSAILLKLVELVRRPEDPDRAARPLLVLPPLHTLGAASFEEFTQLLHDRLGSRSLRSLWICFASLDLSQLTEVHLAIIRSAQKRLGFSLAPEELEWIVSLPRELDRSGDATARLCLNEVLAVLRSAGVRSLEPFSAALPVGVAVQSGIDAFETSVAHDRCASAIADELLALERHSRERGFVVWTPVYQESFSSCSDTVEQQCVRDYRLLRLLAVGTLVLRDVPYRRAPLRWLSRAGVGLASQFGANDAGFKCVDRESEALLSRGALFRYQQGR